MLSTLNYQGSSAIKKLRINNGPRTPATGPPTHTHNALAEATPAAAAEVTATFALGSEVEHNWASQGRWWAGYVVTAAHGDGSYDLQYTPDGSAESRVKADLIRSPPPAPAPEAAAAAPAAAEAADTSATTALGPGFSPPPAGRAPPDILVWDPPAPVVYGASLGERQLSARTVYRVPGTFAYYLSNPFR